MSIFEYDQEKHMRQEREDAWKDGLLEGKASAVISLLENLGPCQKSWSKRQKVKQTLIFWISGSDWRLRQNPSPNLKKKCKIS